MLVCFRVQTLDDFLHIPHVLPKPSCVLNCSKCTLQADTSQNTSSVPYKSQRHVAYGFSPPCCSMGALPCSPPPPHLHIANQSPRTLSASLHYLSKAYTTFLLIHCSTHLQPFFKLINARKSTSLLSLHCTCWQGP